MEAILRFAAPDCNCSGESRWRPSTLARGRGFVNGAMEGVFWCAGPPGTAISNRTNSMEETVYHHPRHDRRAIRSLEVRSDRRGLIQLGTHVAVLVVTATA